MPISYIGSTAHVAASSPTSEDLSGFEGASYTEIAGVVSVSEIGDNVEDIAYERLADGRRVHLNGVKDMGEITITFEYQESDPGQEILRDGRGSQTQHSFKVEDTDGALRYFAGVVASVRDSERNTTNYKGQTATLRPQTGDYYG